MDEDQIAEEYEEEKLKYKFPAYRYWKNSELLGDNFDVFIAVEYGDPIVVGTTQEDDHWVATVIKEGIEQEKKFRAIDYEVAEDGVRPYSEYPEESEYSTETPMVVEPPTVFPDSPEGEETAMPDLPSELPDSDDSTDVQVDSGGGQGEVDLGSEIESEGSLEDIPEGEPDVVTP